MRIFALPKALLVLCAGITIGACASRGSTVDVRMAPGYLQERIRMAFAHAGANRASLSQALEKANAEEREVLYVLLAQSPLRYHFRSTGEWEPDAASASGALFGSHARLAVEARGTFPWTQALSEQDFRAFVAAYRMTTEEPSDWRPHFWNNTELEGTVQGFSIRMSAAGNDAERSRILRELVHFLNSEWLASRVRYEPRGMPDLAPEATLEQGRGRCTDLTNTAIALLRSYGIAATGVRTIWWPRQDSNHYWIGVLDPWTHLWYDVEGAAKGACDEEYFQCQRHNAAQPHAKVYRIVPGLERGRVSGLLQEEEGPLPPFVNFYLRSLPMEDVTRLYAPTLSVTLGEMPASRIVYLCVFNNGGWLEVAAERAGSDGRVTFRDVGSEDVLYLPTWTEPKDTRAVQKAAGRPFLLKADGRRVELGSVRPTATMAPAESFLAENPAPGRALELRQWQGDRFVKLREIPSSSGKQVEVSGLAPYQLYILWSPGTENAGEGSPVGRPFVLEETGGRWQLVAY